MPRADNESGVVFRPRILTIHLETYYGKGHGVSNEAMIFGRLFEQLGFEHFHLPLEKVIADPLGLRSTVAALQPLDVIFTVPFETVLWQLGACKGNAKVLAWMSDDSWRYEFSRKWQPFCDYIVTTDPDSLARYERDGYHGAILSNWGARPDIWRTDASPSVDGCYFSGIPYGDRAQIVNAIASLGVGMSVNNCWPNPLPPEHYWQATALHRFNLALTKGSGGGHQMKLRLFEPQLFGSVLVAEWWPGLDAVWADDECIKFRTPNEAAARMLAMTDDEREAMAAKAKARLLREHTMQERFKAIFDHMGVMNG